MQDKIEIEERWDFYRCRVDDAPGSMSVNMAYINHAPIKGADHVYWLKFEIESPGEHGMGTGDSVDTLYDVEDRVIEILNESPLYFTGRLRNNGRWEMYFFGPNGLDAAIDAAATNACSTTQAIPYDFGSKADPDWASYTDFIYPTPERHRWMLDRSVVDALAENGDQHGIPRRVDHWIYFKSKDDRDTAAIVYEAEGFIVEKGSDDNDGDKPFGLQVYRNDQTELNHINSVTRTLTEIASKHNGEYDGWETFIIRDEE